MNLDLRSEDFIEVKANLIKQFMAQTAFHFQEVLTQLGIGEVDQSLIDIDYQDGKIFYLYRGHIVAYCCYSHNPSDNCLSFTVIKRASIKSIDEACPLSLVPTKSPSK